jgi:Helix-turn-helix domain
LFDEIVDHVSNFEAFIDEVKKAHLADVIYSVRETADLLGMKPDSVRKARIQGRILGIKINEKEWGFYKSEIDRYLQRYERPRP